MSNGHYFLKNMGLPGLFLFIFVLFKHKFKEKTVGFNGIQTRIVRLEGEHADHLTTTTALLTDITTFKAYVSFHRLMYNLYRCMPKICG